MATADTHMLTGAYALDAVTGAERAHFEQHLLVCGTCAQEVRELREVATRMGVAATVQPDQGLRTAVLAEVAATRQTRPLDPGPRSRRTRIAVALFAAAAAVGGIVAGVALSEHPAPTAPVAAGSADVRQAPDANTFTSRGAGGTLTATVSRSLGKVSVALDGMPSLDARHAYQVWLIGPGGAHSAGLLRPGSGPAPLVGALPPDTDRIGVTVEPAGGSPRPTTAGVARLDLS
ncbi:anti-sigma factor domain-containing protein [Amycolatopsis halotolerans]|uniref:Regulator of SigK n=1 Tax=Amycolatopsis halotolerans TaxID=330083 RepID=A0ABV7QB06_9PSEU